MFNKIGILGLGLIGGSLARALKKYHYGAEIYGYNRNVTALQEALESGAIDIAVQDFALFSDCDLIVLCCPVNINIRLFQELLPFLKEGVIISDVGSTKNDIHAAIGNFSFPGTFIGGHPMAGSEKSGFSATKAELFENAYYVLTPESGASEEQIQEMRQMAETINAIPVVLDPKEHDYIVAAISHVPHLLASSLVNLVENLDTPNKDMHRLAAGGFKDFTRIASSSPEMWQQICLANEHSVLIVLDQYIHLLQDAKTALLQKDESSVYRIFEQSKNYRNTFLNKAIGSIEMTHALYVDIEDVPGIIAKVATHLGQHEISIKNIGINNNREDIEGVLEIVFYDGASVDESAKLLIANGYTVHRN